MESKLGEIQSELEAMKKAREEVYKNLIMDMSKEKCESKLTAYKLKSALKYESHIRTEKHAEIHAHISSICISN